jgi:tRNA pseudouridine55 synthase
VTSAARSQGEVPSGLLVVDKPAGWTSHDVVARVRRLAGTRKVGHAGTLDPMATGVLVLGVEKATRLLTYVVGADKEYDATIRLGVATTTDDAEGEVTHRVDASALTRAEVEAAVDSWTGAVEQVPSSVSAIKVDGRRAYARVRAGEDVELAARSVVVHRFAVHDVRSVGATTDVDVTVECSSGTYVRALARDVGSTLGVGGHLTSLRRTRVGEHTLGGARSLEDLAGEFAVLPLGEAARRMFPVRVLTPEEEATLGHGGRIRPTEVVGTVERPVAACTADGSLVALLADRDGWSRPVVVLAPR